MPDALHFDHLGETRRCIEDGCGTVFRPWEKRAMATHFREHERERKTAAARRRRESVKRLKLAARLRREARA